MTIHDAKVEVTCDGRGCRESTYVDLHAGARNTYLADDAHIENDLIRQDWLIGSDGKHYCSPECAEIV